ncbi:MAG: ATP-dependent zinc protease [Pseudomonadales bacterium]|nr:ATP-dependent zinc protease [Pseudomonadales bacterium]
MDNRDTQTDSPLRKPSERITLGWREWVGLPALGRIDVLAKVDTGAKTCALHAFYIDDFEREGEPWVRFGLHPDRHSDQYAVHCEARVKEKRDVTDSGGHTENRYVIETKLDVGPDTFAAEVTLTNRDNMKYRFLLGRNALRRRFLVDPARSWRLGKRDT